MSELQAAIEDFTRLTIARLRGDLPLDERARLEALETMLRDRVDGARPAPRKIENPTAVAPPRPSMNVKPAQVTVTRRGPGEEPSGASPSVAPAPVRTAPAPSPPAPAASRPAPAPLSAPSPPARPSRGRDTLDDEAGEVTRLSTQDQGKLQEISARSIPSTAYTPSASPLYLDDYYDATVAPDLSLSGNSKAQKVIALGEETQALPEEARVFLGLSDAPVVRAASSSGSFGLSMDVPDGEATEMRGDGEETEAREPSFVATRPAFPSRAPVERDNSDTAAGPAPARVQRTPAPPPPARATAPAAPPATPPRAAARPTPAAPAPAASAPSAAAAAALRARAPLPAAEAPARPIVPIIVQLLGGETKRGELVVFEPESGRVSLRATPQSPEESLDVNDIFAVFVGHARGVPPQPATGTRIAVRMTNDREVVGVSPDYAPGANAMTLVPDDRRTVDRIWIPAWSVTEIRFA